MRDKLLDLFHFLMQKKNPKTENPLETATSPNSEVRQMEENRPEAERVTNIHDPLLRTGADEVNVGQEELAFEDELPSPTHIEELDDLVSELGAENHGDETDIVNGKEQVGGVAKVEGVEDNDVEEVGGFEILEEDATSEALELCASDVGNDEGEASEQTLHIGGGGEDADEVEDAQHHHDQVFGDHAQLGQQQIEDPQLEELQLINKAHTFFAEHISAGQVKTGAF